MKNEVTLNRFNSLVKYNNIISENYNHIFSIMNDIFIDSNYSDYKNNVQIDPRNNKKIIYSPQRKQRYTYRNKIEHKNIKCTICCGETTPVIKKEELSNNAYTFINENLYPAVLPFKSADEEIDQIVLKDFKADYYKGFGNHFIQWISTHHEDDIDTLDSNDLLIVLKMLAEFEMYLLHSEASKLPLTQNVGTDKHYGYVSIIKNTGKIAGSSMEHPHIQIIHSNIIPANIENDTNFILKNKCSFIEYLNNITKDDLLIFEDDYIKAVIPYFMSRPYQTIIYPQNKDAANFHDLNYNEFCSLVECLKYVLRAVKNIADKENISFSYNILFHNGPVGTFYLEVLPSFQSYGGYEHLGLYICEFTPEECKAELEKEKMEE